jgi:hypothetical protein
MDQATVTLSLSIVGTSVALVLAAIRVCEFFRDRRPKLSVVARLTSCEVEGNDMIVLNNSKVPANIYYFDLVWAKQGFLGKNVGLGRRFLNEQDPLGGDPCDITVPPHQQYSLNFSEQNHFGWRSEDDLYLRLSLVGRRSPLWLWVSGPRKARRRPPTHAIECDDVI